MISKKQWLTLVAVAVLLVLAFILISSNKRNDKEVDDINNEANTENTVNDQVGDTDKLKDESIKIDTKKIMTDIKEFSFEVLKEGTGVAAVAGKEVTVDYKGTFLDGKVFDQGTFPFTLGVGQVVQGFDKGVLGMKVGETRKIYIPSEMGYGARGAGASIPPNTDLIFEVTLKSIK